MPIPPRFEYADYSRTVIGFHGTSEDVADGLVAGEPFRPSERDGEWFGRGVYFWEHAPRQAWTWAREVRKHKRPAVVGAIIRLGNCLDLLDPVNVAAFKAFYLSAVEEWRRTGVPVPANVREHKKLDCAVFNVLYAASDRDDGATIESARAVYVPAGRELIYKGSWIHANSHVQLCVRDQRNILAVWHARPGGGYGKKSGPERRSTGVSFTHLSSGSAA